MRPAAPPLRRTPGSHPGPGRRWSPARPAAGPAPSSWRTGGRASACRIWLAGPITVNTWPRPTPWARTCPTPSPMWPTATPSTCACWTRRRGASNASPPPTTWERRSTPSPAKGRSRAAWS